MEIIFMCVLQKHNDVFVKDSCHTTGQFTVAAAKEDILKHKITKQLLIFFYNPKGYDSRFLTKNTFKFNKVASSIHQLLHLQKNIWQ